MTKKLSRIRGIESTRGGKRWITVLIRDDDQGFISKVTFEQRLEYWKGEKILHPETSSEVGATGLVP